MKRYIGALLGVLIALSNLTSPVHALDALKVQPLEYNAVLKTGDKKRGVIDISNPTEQFVVVKTSVQAVRQINNEGELEFYDDKELTAGIKLDHDEFRIKPRGAYRMIFELDAAKLPSGDSVAAIFFQVDSRAGTLRTTARVGTLLFLTNGTPSSRDATITDLRVNSLQTGSDVAGSYTVANPGAERAATGYRPEVTIRLTPFMQEQTTTGPLVFAGKERHKEFSLPVSRIGVYQLSVRTGESTQAKWIVIVPTWTWFVVGGLGLVAISLLMMRRRRSISRRTKKRR